VTDALLILLVLYLLSQQRPASAAAGAGLVPVSIPTPRLADSAAAQVSVPAQSVQQAQQQAQEAASAFIRESFPERFFTCGSARNTCGDLVARTCYQDSSGLISMLPADDSGCVGRGITLLLGA
jgi:hypothetical protein